MKNLSYCLIAVTVMLPMIFLIGCSDDDSSTTPASGSSDWTNVQFADYDGMVEDIAPPLYSGVSTSPANLDDWTTGDYPLLGKVFSEEEPMSLYWNLNMFTEIISEIEQFLLINESGYVMVDSSLSEGDMNVYEYIDVELLTSTTILPSDMSSVLGSTIDLDYMVTAHFPDMDEDQIFQVGFIMNDDEETILAFEKMPESDMITSSMAFYAHFDAVDSSMIIKGVFFKDYGDETSARWVYDIHSVDESNFSYRMSWFSEDIQPEPSMLACIIGGGNKNVEFALRYREFKPADSADYYEGLEKEQVFGPNYTEGASLITAFSDYVDEELFFLYDDMPTTLLTSPWAEE